MDHRDMASVVAAGFLGVALTVSATHVLAQPPGTAVVEGTRPSELQATISYADLDLALLGDQQRLKRRIFQAAGQLCGDFTDLNDFMDCRTDAIRSADDPFAQAVAHAQGEVAELSAAPAMTITMAVSAR